jgi:hypothetical protein
VSLESAGALVVLEFGATLVVLESAPVSRSLALGWAVATVLPSSAGAAWVDGVALSMTLPLSSPLAAAPAVSVALWSVAATASSAAVAVLSVAPRLSSASAAVELPSDVFGLDEASVGSVATGATLTT